MQLFAREIDMGTAGHLNDAGRKRRPYRCFLFRCWLEEGTEAGSEPGWRFTVQQAGPNTARHCFACLSDAVAYVETQLSSCTDLSRNPPLTFRRPSLAPQKRNPIEGA